MSIGSPLGLMLLDFETQSIVSIINPLYTSHYSTKALCMSWGLQGGTGRLWWHGEPCPDELIAHVEAGGLIGASNARFDREIWNYVATNDHDFPETDDKQWFCTQAQSRCAGLPSALDKAAKALGLLTRKSTRGTLLISRCCIPPFSEDPQDYADLGAYCLQDWVVMDAAARAVPAITPVQLEDYQLNERINDRGIRIDRDLARAASAYAEAERSEINKKLDHITCGTITKCTQYKRVSTWLRECLEDDGLEDVVKLMVKHITDKETGITRKMYSSDKGVRANMMSGHRDGVFCLPWDIMTLLGLMEDAGGSAVSKFHRMDQKASPVDDRVRGILRYAGAPSTQRYSSLGLQVHNFRRDAFSPAYAEFLKEQMLKGEVLRGLDLKRDAGTPALAEAVAELKRQGEDTKSLNGKVLGVMDTLGRLLRSAIIPAAGKVFVVGDWNAVESRMTAWLVGDENKLDLFRRGDCPYCYAAEGIYGYPINKKDHPDQRSVGKVTDLALGFLGGEGALASMAEQYKVYIPPESRQDIVDAYRARHPKTVAFGNACEAAAIRAIKYPGVHQKVRNVSYVFCEGDGALYCVLPGGMNVLRYPEARLEMVLPPWSTPQKPAKKITQITALKAAFTPKAGAKEWARHSLWRGLFVENVAQAECCQELRGCLVECEDEDLDVVFHVHDEIVLEVWEKDAPRAVEILQDMLETTAEYLPGLPLVAKPEIMTRYGK